MVNYLRYFPLFVSSIALGFAFLSQYFWDLFPCNLCIYQRYAHAFIIIASLININANSVWSYLSVLIAVLLSTLVSAYHSGVERGLFKGLDSCSSSLSSKLTPEELYDKIMNSAVVKCSDVQWDFYGASMADLNFLVSFVLLVLVVFFLKFNNAKKT